MIRSTSSIISIALIVYLQLVSCNKDDDNALSNDYLPLQAGNYWEFSPNSLDSIDKIVNLEGYDYYRMLHIALKTRTYGDTVYYRKTSDGKVYIRSKRTTGDILKFDLEAKAGQTWEYPNTWNLNYPWNVTLMSKKDIIQLGNERIKNCYRYYYDVPESADEESCLWLGPGVGFVLKNIFQSTAGADRLTKVRINGVERQF